MARRTSRSRNAHRHRRRARALNTSGSLLFLLGANAIRTSGKPLLFHESNRSQADSQRSRVILQCGVQGMTFHLPYRSGGRSKTLVWLLVSELAFYGEGGGRRMKFPVRGWLEYAHGMPILLLGCGRLEYALGTPIVLQVIRLVSRFSSGTKQLTGRRISSTKRLNPTQDMKGI